MRTESSPIQLRRNAALLIIPAVVLVQGGCTTEQSKLATVHGRVTVDGKPVPGAQILFMPPGDRVATGTTDEDGYYRLSTFDKHDGAVVSQHLVTITCLPLIPVQPMTADMAALPAGPKIELPQDENWVSPIPKKYSDPANPPFSIRVKPGDNEIDFDLDSEDGVEE